MIIITLAALNRLRQLGGSGKICTQFVARCSLELHSMSLHSPMSACSSPSSEMVLSAAARPMLVFLELLAERLMLRRSSSSTGSRAAILYFTSTLL